MYDADGVCATAIMYIGLKELSRFYDFNLHYIIPLRQDGYGLSTKTVTEAKEYNADLIITVDNGIAADKAIEYAKSLDMDVIVTDHHKALIDPVSNEEILPKCLIIDPQIDKYPYKFICGACVAFKFIEKLFEETLNDPQKNQSFRLSNKKMTLQDYHSDLYDELLSLNAIATVADVMKITDENRYYVGIGLKKLAHCKNQGLRILLRSLDLGELNVNNIAYTIGPIINAAGRLETPYIALDLLLAEDTNECIKLAKKLISLNSQRRKLQRQAIENIPENILKNNFIVIYDATIEKGILGSIASAIADKYKKPTFVLTGQDNLTGSGRTANGYPILSFIHESKDLVSGGGHEAACGITLAKEKLDELQIRCNNHYNKWLIENDKDTDSYLYILNEIDFKEIDFLHLANILSVLEPYGQGNPAPLFMTQNVNILSANIIGSNENVIKFELEKDNIKLQAVGFTNIVSQYKEHMNKIDIVYSIGLDEWRKNKLNQLIVQLQIIDFHYIRE